MEQSSAKPTLTWGQQLTIARHQQGLSIEQVAEQLKLLPRIVEALETENSAQLPEPIFIKGYLRLYAQLLALPFEQLAQDFDRHYYSKASNNTNKAEPKVLQILDHQQPHHIQRFIRVSQASILPKLIKVLVVIALLIAVIAGIWQSALFRQNQSTTIESSANNASRTIDLPNVTSTRQSIDRLELTFSAQTKLRIADANGQELANTTKQAGENLSLQGQSPFAIELNPASAVEFRFNNNVIDLKPYTVNGAVNFRLSR